MILDFIYIAVAAIEQFIYILCEVNVISLFFGQIELNELTDNQFERS